MAKLLCVFSTLAAPMAYTDFHTADNGVPVAKGEVLIKGGAGVMNENLLTPRGVPTMVTEKQVELLKRNSVFQLHERNGYVVIDEVDRPPGETEIEQMAAVMTGRDNSAPLVAEDFTANGQPAPKTDAAPKATRRK